MGRIKREQYRQELDTVKASEYFKQNTKYRMMQQLKNPTTQEEEARAKRPRARKWGGWAVACSAMLLFGVVGIRLLPGLLSPAVTIEPEAAPEPPIAESSESVPERKPSEYFSVEIPVPETDPAPEEILPPDSGVEGGGDTTEEPPQSTPPASEPAVEEPTVTGGEPPEGDKQAEQEALPPLPQSPASTTTAQPSGTRLVDPAPQPQPDEEPPPEQAGESGEQEDDMPEELRLPVFANTSPRGADGQYTYTYSERELVDIIDEQAAALGVSMQSYLADTGGVTARGEEYAILACPDGTIEITLDTPALPDVGPVPDAENSAEVQEQYALALVEEYSELFAGMQQPVAEASGYVTDDGTLLWQVHIYDKGTSPLAQTLNRSLSGATFLSDEEGRLTGLRLWRASVGEVLGSYPIISPEEATALLNQDGWGLLGEEAGEDAAFPGEEAVEDVQLVYLYLGEEQYLVPCYAVIAWQQNEAEDAPDTLGIWYIAAVEGEYLAED